MAKGSDFEREICKKLSLWWTEGSRDDIFWRTAGSGARATSRAKRGKDTAMSHGDITATDPIGAPLLERVTIEIKRGYSDASVAVMLDKPDRAKQQPWEAFVEQTILSADEAGTLEWWLIWRRDRKETLIFTPSTRRGWKGLPPCAVFFLNVRFSDNTLHRIDVFACRLDDFLQHTKPSSLQ